MHNKYITKKLNFFPTNKKDNWVAYQFLSSQGNTFPWEGNNKVITLF